MNHTSSFDTVVQIHNAVVIKYERGIGPKTECADFLEVCWTYATSKKKFKLVFVNIKTI